MQRSLIAAIVLGSLALVACHNSDREKRREERRAERERERAGQPPVSYAPAGAPAAYPSGATPYPAATPGTYPSGAAPMADDREARRERRRAEREGYGAVPATASSGVLNDSAPMNPN